MAATPEGVNNPGTCCTHYSKTIYWGCVSPRSSCPKFAAADCVHCTNYSAVVPDSPLSAAVSKHGACCCWYGRYQLILVTWHSYGEYMEKRLRGGGNHGGGMSWGHDPPLSGSVAVQGSGGPFVHRPPLFTGMLTATAACYKLLTRLISRCGCRASNYLTRL